VQVHEEHSNDFGACTIGAVCLGPTGNDSSGHYFLSLHTGQCVVCHRWTELPIPADAIDRVTQLGHDQGMPSCLTFGDQYGMLLLADDVKSESNDMHDADDSTYVPSSHSNDDGSEPHNDESQSRARPQTILMMTTTILTLNLIMMMTPILTTIWTIMMQATMMDLVMITVTQPLLVMMINWQLSAR